MFLSLLTRDLLLGLVAHSRHLVEQLLADMLFTGKFAVCIENLSELIQGHLQTSLG